MTGQEEEGKSIPITIRWKSRHYLGTRTVLPLASSIAAAIPPELKPFPDTHCAPQADISRASVKTEPPHSPGSP